MSDNILKNPTLAGFSKPPQVVVDAQGKQQYIENPDHWRFIQEGNLNDDPHMIAQSLHRDRGYVIAAGWRRWKAGYQQTATLQKGQRYVCKAVFATHVSPEDKRIDWRFEVVIDSRVVAASAWSTGPYKQEIDHLFVVEARADITVDLNFLARSQWADNACDFNVFAITMEKVAADYAGDQVQYVGSETPAPEPEPEPEPTPTPDVDWIKRLDKFDKQRVLLGRLALSLDDVVGDDITSVKLYRLIGRMAEMLDAR